MGHLAGKKINLTKNQSLVMEVLSDSKSPVSAYSILEKLRDKGFRAPLQVYRALDKLVASGMAHRIESVNAFVACNRSDDDSDSMVGFIICIDCGHVKEIIIITEENSYADPPREISYFAYKRINHFNEWLAQFQAKETTDIPEEVYKGILVELKKNKFINIQELSYKNMREILKKLKYNKYYEHIPHIINMINGKKAPILTRQYEEQLRNMFKEIQTPFMQHCPENRKNFLSYSYVLHKFCELLELDHLLIYFPLLKSREKLQQQDKIWSKICGTLMWEYIPSI